MIVRQIGSPIPMPLDLVVKKLSNSRAKDIVGNTGAVVFDSDRHAAIRRHARRDRQFMWAALALRHRLHGVDRQIDDDLLKLDRVAKDAR